MSSTQTTIKSKLLGYLYELWQEHLITCIAVSQYYSNIHIASFVLHINRTVWKPIGLNVSDSMKQVVFHIKCSFLQNTDIRAD